jgi:predicted nucleic acid-binding protein
MILLDTNILTRFADAGHPHSAVARNVVDTLRRRRERLVLVPQNLYEFWAVATRPTGHFPTANGLGMSAARTDQWIAYWLRIYALLPDPPDFTAHWRSLVHLFNVLGKKSHDARLAAAARVHKVPMFLTFNTKDFQRFPFLTLLDPHTV